MCATEIKKQLRTRDLRPNADQLICHTKVSFIEFDKHFLDYQNNIFRSFNFLEIKREQGEKFADCYSRFRFEVVEYNNGESLVRLLRDKIIQGLKGKELQYRLTSEIRNK